MAPHSSFKSLRLDGVSRAFGTVNALRDLSLEIQRGEFIALLGPSGCGKSTALNCIAGLLPTTAGSIYLDDRRIDTLAVEDRGFGMVFQNYALFPHMSVRANIGFGLKMRNVPKAQAEARIDQAIRTVRLETQAHKLPGQLSGGQQQRVAIARAIAIDPPLVLMDEPLSNLDAKLRLEMRQEIRRIHQSLGCVTIYVTHDQDEALSLADRIVVLRDGMIRQVGKPEDLYARPEHLDVAEFMGFRNQIRGALTGVGSAEKGAPVTLTVGGTTLDGVAQEPLSGSIVAAAIRPDDLVPVAKSAPGIEAVVEAIEYRGRDFFGSARASGGEELFFRAERRVPPGEKLRLGAGRQRVLVYAGA
jgi:putative spermidine/putrescine transport system ATP-binding protein